MEPCARQIIVSTEGEQGTFHFCLNYVLLFIDQEKQSLLRINSIYKLQISCNISLSELLLSHNKILTV